MNRYQKARLIAALELDIEKNGPVLLWSGEGKIPANFRGIIPRTLLGYLEIITKESLRAATLIPRADLSVPSQGDGRPTGGINRSAIAGRVGTDPP